MPPLAIAIAIAIVIVTAIAIVAAIGLCFGLPSVLPAHRRRLPPAFSPLRHSAAELADGTPPNSMFGLKKKIRAPRAADAALSPGMSPKPSVGVLPGMSPKLEMDLPELDIDTNLGLADSSYSSDLPETVSSPIVSPKPVRSLRFDNVIHHIPTPSHETDTRILSDSDSDDPHDHTFSADDEEERTAAGPGTNSDRIDPRNEQRKGKSGAVSSDDGDDDVPLGMLGDGARAPSEFTSIKAEVRLEKYMKKTKRTSRLINPDDNLPLALTRLQLQEQMPAVSLPPDSASPKLQPSQQLKRTPTASAANLPSPKMPDSSPRQPHAAPSANPHSGHNRSLHDPAVDTVPHRRATEYPSPYDNQANGKKITARVYIQDASTFTMMVLTPQMNSVQVTSDLVVRSNLDPLLGWTLFEICNDFGVERPLRDWEIVSDVVSSWDSSNSVNAIVLKVYGLRDTLLPESIIGRYPKVQGWVHLEIKPGKWQRRFLSLKDGGVSYFKDGESGSQVFLCSLGAFDVYTLCKKRNRAPTNFCFALKSTSSISFFENKDDYIKFVCVDREDRLFDWVMSLRIAQSEKTFSDNPELFDNLSGIPPQAYERRLRKFQKEDVLKPNPILSGTHSSGHVANAGLPDHRMSRRDRAEETSSPYGRGAFDRMKSPSRWKDSAPAGGERAIGKPLLAFDESGYPHQDTPHSSSKPRPQADSGLSESEERAHRRARGSPKIRPGEQSRGREGEYSDAPGRRNGESEAERAERKRRERRRREEQGSEPPQQRSRSVTREGRERKPGIKPLIDISDSSNCRRCGCSFTRDQKRICSNCFHVHGES